MADILVVNKADDNRIDLAKKSQRAYKNALHLFPPKENNWIPKVLHCSALENKGVMEVWEMIKSFQEHTQQNGSFEQNRVQQSTFWMHQSIRQQLEQLFYQQEALKPLIAQAETDVIAGRTSPFRAAQDLLETFKQIIKKE